MLESNENDDMNNTLIEPEMKQRTKSELDKQIENDTKSRKYIIEASNPYKIYWDLLVILSALTTSFFVPVEIAFREIDRTFDSYIFTHIL